MYLENQKKLIVGLLITAVVLKFMLFLNEFITITQSEYQEMTFMKVVNFTYSMFIELLPIIARYGVILGVEKLIEQVEKNNKLTNENFKLIRNGITGNSGNHYDDNYKGSMLKQALDNMESNTIVPPRKRCPECNTYCKSDALYCPGCGKKLE